MFEAKTDLKTAIFFADGCEEIEGLTVVDLLYRAGIPCTKVSINDIPEVTSSHEVTFRTDTTIAELDFSEYDMLILPAICAPVISLWRKLSPSIKRENRSRRSARHRVSSQNWVF